MVCLSTTAVVRDIDSERRRLANARRNYRRIPYIGGTDIGTDLPYEGKTIEDKSSASDYTDGKFVQTNEKKYQKSWFAMEVGGKP